MKFSGNTTNSYGTIWNSKCAKWIPFSTNVSQKRIDEIHTYQFEFQTAEMYFICENINAKYAVGHSDYRSGSHKTHYEIQMAQINFCF